MNNWIFEISNFHDFHGEIPYKCYINVAQIPFFYANFFFSTSVFFPRMDFSTHALFFPADANLIVLDCEPPNCRLAPVWNIARPDEIVKMQLLTSTAAKSNIYRCRLHSFAFCVAKKWIYLSFLIYPKKQNKNKQKQIAKTYRDSATQCDIPINIQVFCRNRRRSHTWVEKQKEASNSIFPLPYLQKKYGGTNL